MERLRLARRDAQRAVDEVRRLEGALDHARDELMGRGLDPVVRVSDPDAATPADEGTHTAG